MADRAADATLDATGLPCPLPVLKARKALSNLAPGAVLAVLTDDPAAAQDFEAFCQTTGNRLLCQTLDAGVRLFLIEKAREADCDSAVSESRGPARP